MRQSFSSYETETVIRIWLIQEILPNSIDKDFEKNWFYILLCNLESLFSLELDPLGDGFTEGEDVTLILITKNSYKFFSSKTRIPMISDKIGTLNHISIVRWLTAPAIGF